MLASAPSPPAPRSVGGYPLWADSWQQVEVRFVGRGDERSRAETLAAVEPGAPPVAALRQVHSPRVWTVSHDGFQGEGDALVSAERGLALSVITADCVPVLVAADTAVAAVHAGWRGLVAGVIPAALAAMPGGAVRAWIGPAIGSCCYEVGEDVAAQVVAVSGPAVVSDGPHGRPHLDLRLAAAEQLRAAGVFTLTSWGPCTRCRPELLWSYRRDGKAAGRNIAYIWRR